MLLITCLIFGLLGSLSWAAGPRGRTVCPFGTFAHAYRGEWYCYEFYGDRLTFQEAEQECQYKRKGHLASFNSDNQAKSVGVYVAKENLERDYVWIGLQRDEESNLSTGWRWVDGSQSRYRKWGYEEPNNLGHNEFCVSLDLYPGYLTWNDLDCSSKLPFLCKWKPS